MGGDTFLAIGQSQFIIEVPVSAEATLTTETFLNLVFD